MNDKPRFKSIDCIVCGFKINILDYEGIDQINDEKWEPSSQMWNSGMVNHASAGYGSIYDGYSLYVGICDKCIKSKLNDGSLVYWRNYLGKDNENRKKFDIIRNRKDNLDRLLD